MLVVHEADAQVIVVAVVVVPATPDMCLAGARVHARCLMTC